MLKTFALRGRELPITVYGPPGLRDLFDALRRIFGRLTYMVELKELRPGDELIRDDYRLATFAVAHGVSAVGYALVEEPRPGRFDVAGGRCARRARRGPSAARSSAGESVTLAGRARRSRPDEVLGSARPGPEGRDRGRHGAVRVGDRGRARRRPARARGDVPARTSATGRARRCTRPRSRRRGSPATPGVELLALTHLSNRYFGRRGRARGAARSSRRRSSRGTSIRSTSASRSGVGRSS